MIIEWEDENGDIEPINTDDASREELVEACIGLQEANARLEKALAQRIEAFAACGLAYADNGYPVLVDRAKLDAWLAEEQAT